MSSNPEPKRTRPSTPRPSVSPRNHIPGSVWLLLLTVASLGCITSSYASGAEGERSAFSGIVLPFLVAVVITVIFDLPDPRRGLIRITQQPLVDLQQSMQATQR